MRARSWNDNRRRSLGVEALEDRRVLAVFTVMDIGDNGPGTLRDAIDKANVLPGNDLINFSEALHASTIHIQTQLEITDGVTIDGGAFPGGMTISASHADATPFVHDGLGTRVFHVTQPIDPLDFQQTQFLNLRLAGGDVDGDGGAIYNADGLVDGSDFIIWNANRFQSSAVLAAHLNHEELNTDLAGSISLQPTGRVPARQTGARLVAEG